MIRLTHLKQHADPWRIRAAHVLCIALCAFLYACGGATTGQPAPQPAEETEAAADAPQPAEETEAAEPSQQPRKAKAASETPPTEAAQAAPTAPPLPDPPARPERVSPCQAASGADGSAGTPAAQQSQAPANADLDVRYDGGTNTIVLRKGKAPSLAAVGQALGQNDALRELAAGEWLLGASLQIEEEAALRIAAPEVRWLKLRSDAGGFAAIKVLGGQLEVAGTCVSSWDPASNSFDENHTDGRSFVLARDGARMDIRGSELRSLGYDAYESYGVAWRLKGTRGEIVDSILAYNFYGLYSYQASGLVMRGNEVHHNILYGLDPHTGSGHLVIENNAAHDNGKHGIILAEECSDSVIRNNVVYNNAHHGIVIYQRSNNNIVEHNWVYGNGEQGININDASDNQIRNNIVYDNREDGIGIGQQASQNEVVGNDVRTNRKDGITIFSDATDNILRDNIVIDNQRYGIYVKSEGNERIEKNEVFGNAVGVYLNTDQLLEVVQQANKIYSNAEADVRSGDEQPATDQKGAKP